MHDIAALTAVLSCTLQHRLYWHTQCRGLAAAGVFKGPRTGGGEPDLIAGRVEGLAGVRGIGGTLGGQNCGS
eukprot:9352095-Alexandrium_andersonii.AAC.1